MGTALAGRRTKPLVLHDALTRQRPSRRVLNGRALAIAKSAPINPKYQGARVHLAVTREIGSRILWGEFSPGEVLPNEAAWSRTLRGRQAGPCRHP